MVACKVVIIRPREKLQDLLDQKEINEQLEIIEVYARFERRWELPAAIDQEEKH